MVRKGVERPKPLKAIPAGLPAMGPDFTQPRDFFVTASGVGVGGPVQLLELYGKVAKELRDKHYTAQVVGRIVSLNKGLKLFGPQLETTHKEVLDRYQVFLRNACRDGSLDLVARLQLLEVLELRAMKWKPNDNVTNYYKTKMLQVEQCEPNYFHSSDPSHPYQPLQAFIATGNWQRPAQTGPPAPQPTPLNANAMEFRPPVSGLKGMALNPQQQQHSNGGGVVVNDTARYLASATASLTSILSVNSRGDSQPPVPSIPPPKVSTGKIENVPGKQQIREEVVISDSGKVEVGSSGDRCVQVIGTDEKTIALAKSLIEETIQKNSSPDPVEVRTSTGTAEANNNWMIQNKANLGKFSYTIEVGNENIAIVGGNADMVRAAKIALDGHFVGSGPEGSVKPIASFGGNNLGSSDAVCQTEKVSITYDRRRLLSYSASPLCRQPPTNWTKHWTPALKKELGRNLQPKPNLEEKAVEAGALPAYASNYFVPEPEKFLNANAKFPQGFVRLPLHHRRSISDTGNGGGGDHAQDGQSKDAAVSHLDQLFSGASAYQSGQRRAPKSKTEIERLLDQCGQTWDDASGSWVSSAQQQTRK